MHGDIINNMKNRLVAQILNRVADFMDLKGDEFRSKAYRRAARTIELLGEDIEEVAAQDRLQELPGVGRNIASKIREILDTGSLHLLHELMEEYPVDFDALLSVEGVGPRTVKLLYEELGIKTLDDLEYQAKRHRIRRLRGMGEKKEKAILRNIELARSRITRKPLAYIVPLAQRIKSEIMDLEGVQRVEVAGSIRRGRETVGDIDILVTARDPEMVMDYFTSMETVREVVVRGQRKSTVRLVEDLDCDLRVFDDGVFGSALLYFTGSWEFNVELRRIAQSMGMKLSEYGLFRGDERVAGRTEEEVLEALGLTYIEPELRENRGEIEAAREGRLPELVSSEDVRGDLHMHSLHSDGIDSIADLASYAETLGREYIAVTDHARYISDPDSYLRSIEGVDEIPVLAGVEVSILADGSLEVPGDVLEDFDLVVASVHDGFNVTERLLGAMDHDVVDIIGHPTGRVLGTREPVVDIERVTERAAEAGVALEVNSNPLRLDLRDTHIRMAIEAGCKLAINSDAHSRGGLENIRWGVLTARRGWATCDDVINTLSFRGLKRWLEI